MCVCRSITCFECYFPRFIRGRPKMPSYLKMRTEQSYSILCCAFSFRKFKISFLVISSQPILRLTLPFRAYACFQRHWLPPLWKTNDNETKKKSLYFYLCQIKWFEKKWLRKEVSEEKKNSIKMNKLAKCIYTPPHNASNDNCMRAPQNVISSRKSIYCKMRKNPFENSIYSF